MGLPQLTMLLNLVNRPAGLLGLRYPPTSGRGVGVVEEDGVLSVTAWPFPDFRSPVLCPRAMPGTRKLSMRRGRLCFRV